MAGYGKKKDEDNGEFLRLREDLKAGTPRSVYAFYGQERFLLEDSVRKLRATVTPGTEEFNHHRLDGKNFDVNELRGALDALPAFSERTFTEISDLDFSKLSEEARGELVEILSDIPDYTTIVFIFDSVEFKLDGRIKANQELKKRITAVEFRPMDEAYLTRWLAKGFAAAGKRITRDAARELIAMTGGLMTGMRTEVEKLSSYCAGEAVDVPDVRAIVTPVPEAAAWELTDALITGRRDDAMDRLSELFKMNEAPHKISFSISQKLRQLLIAKICRENGAGVKELMSIAGIRLEFQARALMDAARKTGKDRCVEMLDLACQAALALNSTSRDGQEILTMLVVRILAMPK